MAARGVLDLTFMDLKDENDVIKQIEDSKQNPGKGNETPSKRKKEEIKGLRLSNNSISGFQLFMSLESSSLDCQKIMWVDLSFNQLKRVDENLAEFLPNLSTLYLHANQISKYSDIRRLSCFTKMKSLTLYGNPVEEQKHYRNVVLFYFPNLTQVDFSVISPGEREKVASWALIYRKCLNFEDTLKFD